MSYAATRWLYMRLLGVVFLAAFASLWPQVAGLVGPRGILPVSDYLAQARATAGAWAYWQLPTLAWVSTSERFLEALCAAGVVLAALLVLGVAQRAVLALSWALYLSLVVAGQLFLSFQWDVLLLEAGLLSLFVAPAGLWPRLPRDEPPPWAPGIWLLRILLFKLMLLSGATKLLSLDATWWGLSALDYHYFTQPLPAWTSWYAHHLPRWFGRVSVVTMFAIELVLPFCVFLRRRARLVGCAGIALLQLLIAATGNYGFFNLLTLVLCVSVLDDAPLLRAIPRPLRFAFEGQPSGRQGSAPGRPATLEPHWLRRLAPWALLLAVVLLEGLSLTRELARTARQARSGTTLAGRAIDWAEGQGIARAERTLLRPIAPLRSFNGYGLFRTMTTERRELVVETSADGVSWTALELPYKPGDPRRAPSFVQPHMPRLDWQLWFAALDSQGYAPVLDRLAQRILEGSPPVRALVAGPPVPPRLVRFVIYRYTFTSPEERRRTGAWWSRERLGAGRAIGL